MGLRSGGRSATVQPVIVTFPTASTTVPVRTVSPSCSVDGVRSNGMDWADVNVRDVSVMDAEEGTVRNASVNG